MQCGLETSYWTGINHLFIWGSIVCYFAVTLIMYTSWFQYTYEGVAVNIMSTANFWFTILLCVIILLMPIVTERFYFVDTRPTLTDKVCNLITVLFIWLLDKLFGNPFLQQMRRGNSEEHCNSKNSIPS